MTSKMTRQWLPRPRLVSAFGILAAGLFVNGFSKSYAGMGLADYWPAVLFCLLMLVALVDFLLSRRLPPVTFRRVLAGNLAVDKWAPVTVQIEHSFKQTTQIKLFDGVPSDAEHQQLPMHITLLPKRTSQSQYQLRPLVRGATQITQAQVEFYSPLGLWAIRYWTGASSPIKVYPDFVAIANYGILASEHHTSQIGIKKHQRRGAGMDFHQLREYRQGDSLRQLDWKASARRQKLIARDYQDERDQQIVLMIDSGRRMRAKDDELSHFDHALNAMLLVSYIALRQGDNLSLLSFGSEGTQKHRWIPPQKGVERIKNLLNGIYDLQPSQATADYIDAAQKLTRLQPKRSLVILVTNSRDEDNQELLVAVKLLKKRHLVMVVNIRETILDQLIETQVRDFDDALNYAGAQQFLHQRSERHQQLIGAGIYSIDCSASELAIRVANAYWEIKSAGVL